MTINPVLIPPQVSFSSPETAQSFSRVVVTGEAVDSDGDLVNTNWIQSAGPVVGLERLDKNSITFIAPNVDEATDLSFTFTAVDNDGLQLEKLAVINVLPQEPFELSGFVAFGHDLRFASIDAKRVVDGMVLDPVVGPAGFTEGPLGAFNLSVPGEGRYELTERLILDDKDSGQRTTDDVIVLKAVSDLKPDDDALHINVLTHTASQAALQNPSAVQDLMALRLEPYLGMTASDADSLHTYSTEAREEKRYQVRSVPTNFLQNACSDFEYDFSSPLETKTYLIQNSARLSQYLSRTEGLRSRPIRDGEDPGSQWQLIGLPLQAQFLIRSQVDDALYLAVDDQGTPFLRYVSDQQLAEDNIKWVLEESSIFSSGRRIKNVATGLYLDRNQQQPLLHFLLNHDIRMTNSDSSEFNQAWHFCEVP